jgi:hypothetical protein
MFPKIFPMKIPHEHGHRWLQLLQRSGGGLQSWQRCLQCFVGICLARWLVARVDPTSSTTPLPGDEDCIMMISKKIFF